MGTNLHSWPLLSKLLIFLFLSHFQPNHEMLCISNLLDLTYLIKSFIST